MVTQNGHHATTPAAGFGVVLRPIREQQGLSQSKLARRAGIAREAVSRFESGARYPRPETLVSIADALGVDADWLVLRAVFGTAHPITRFLDREYFPPSEVRR